MGVVTATRGRLAAFLSKAGGLRPLQLKQSEIADRPLAAKGGRRVVIEMDGERIEYAGGMTRVQGRIKPEAQDALEPRLEALGKARDQATAKALSSFDAAINAAKASYEAAINRARQEREIAVKGATATYEKGAREAILSASAPGGGK